ncbi:hypothetical protein AB1N83_014414, partial [Pleurotus pulmonarius]
WKGTLVRSSDWLSPLMELASHPGPSTILFGCGMKRGSPRCLKGTVAQCSPSHFRKTTSSLARTTRRYEYGMPFLVIW